MPQESFRRIIKLTEKMYPNFGDALANSCFSDYAEEHLFIKCENEELVQNLIINLGYRLINIGNVFISAAGKHGQELINDIIRDKLSSGKTNYSYDTLLQVLSEIEVLSYFTRFFKLQNSIYEPVQNDNTKKNPEAIFTYNDSATIEVEVKCPLLNPLDIPKKGDILINYRTPLPKEIYIGRKCYYPLENKLKDYLLSAESKFSDKCIGEQNHYGLLVINWQDFRFDSIESLFFNRYSGLFTENTIIRNSDGSPKQFNKVNGVVLYRGHLNEFVDLRLVPKKYIQNPFSQEMPRKLIIDMFSPISFIQAQQEYTDIEFVL